MRIQPATLATMTMAAQFSDDYAKGFAQAQQKFPKGNKERWSLYAWVFACNASLDFVKEAFPGSPALEVAPSEETNTNV